MPRSIPVDDLQSCGDWNDTYYDEYHEFGWFQNECQFPIIQEIIASAQPAYKEFDWDDMSWNDDESIPMADEDGPELNPDWVALEERIINARVEINTQRDLEQEAADRRQQVAAEVERLERGIMDSGPLEDL